MLILKRKREQQIAIGPDIVVRVLGIKDGLVILGITAPATYKINREDPPPRQHELEAALEIEIENGGRLLLDYSASPEPPTPQD